MAYLRNRKSASPPDATVSDVYSLGLIALEVCTLKPEEAFTLKDYSVNRELIQAKINQIHKSYSISFLEIVIRMLTIDPSKRIPLEELIDASSHLLGKSGLPPLNLHRISEQPSARLISLEAASTDAARGIEATSKDSQQQDCQQSAQHLDGRQQRASQGSKAGSSTQTPIEERKQSTVASEDPHDFAGRSGIQRQASSTSNFKRSPSGTNLLTPDLMQRVFQETEAVQRAKRDSRDVSPTFAGLPPRKPEPDGLTDRSVDAPRQRDPSRTRAPRDRSRSPLLKSYGSRSQQQEDPALQPAPNPPRQEPPHQLLGSSDQSGQSVAVNLNHMFSQVDASAPQLASDRLPPTPQQSATVVFKKEPEPPRYVSPSPVRLQDPHSQGYSFSHASVLDPHRLPQPATHQPLTPTAKPIVIQSDPRPPSIGTAIGSHHAFAPSYTHQYPQLYPSSQKLFPTVSSQAYFPIQLQPSQIAHPLTITSYSQSSSSLGFQPFDLFAPGHEVSRAERNLAAQRDASPSPISGKIVKVTRYSIDKNGDRKLIEEEVTGFSQAPQNLQSYLRASESSLASYTDPFKSDRHVDTRSNRSSSREIVTSSVFKPLEQMTQNVNPAKPPLPTVHKSARDLPPLPRPPTHAPQTQPPQTQPRQAQAPPTQPPQTPKQPPAEPPKAISLQQIDSPRLIEKIYQRDEQGNTVELKTYLEKDGTRRSEKRIAIDSKGQLYGKFRETGVDLNDVIIADPNLLQKIIEEQMQLLAEKKEKLREVIESRDQADLKRRELERVREPQIQAISDSPMKKSAQTDSDEKVKKIELKKMEDSTLKSLARPDQNRDHSPDVQLPGWQRIDSNYKLDFDPHERLEESARPSLTDLQQEKENIPMESIKPSSLYYTESPVKPPSTLKNPSPVKQSNFLAVASPAKPQPLQPAQQEPDKPASRSQAEIIAGIKGKKIKVRYKEHNGKTYPIGIAGGDLKPEEKEWLLRKVLEKEGLTLEEVEEIEGRKLFDNSNLPGLTHPEDPDEDYQLALKLNPKSSNLVKDIQNQIIREQDEELVSQSSAYPSQRRIHGLEDPHLSHGLPKLDLMSRPPESNNTRNDEMWFRTREQQVLEDTDCYKNIEMSKSSKKRTPHMVHSELNGVFMVEVDKNDPELNYESNDDAIAGMAPRFNYDTDAGYNPGFGQSFGSGHKPPTKNPAPADNPSTFDPADIDALLKHNENLLSKIKMDMRNIGESFVSTSEVSGVRASRNQHSGLHQQNHAGFGPSRHSDFDSKDFVDRSPIGLNEFESFKTKNNEVVPADPGQVQTQKSTNELQV